MKIQFGPRKNLLDSLPNSNPEKTLKKLALLLERKSPCPIQVPKIQNSNLNQIKD